jgi:hypothetical protein
MDTKIGSGSDVIGTIGRFIDMVRDGLVTALIVVGIVVLWDLWPEVKQQLTSRPIDSLSVGAFSIKLGEAVASFQSTNFTVNAVGGSADLLEKGSLQDLAQAELQGTGHFDLLGISAGHPYDGSLLLAYLSRLTPKSILFRNGDVLDAWIDAGPFAAQIRPHESYTYESLLASLRGLRKDSIQKAATARDALDAMQKLRLDHLPAVDQNRHFQFMLSRDDILATVVESVVLAAAKPGAPANDK